MERTKYLNLPAFNIMAEETKRYLKLWKRYGNMRLPLKNKRIMIIGFPYFQQRNPSDALCFSLARLDMELRLIDVLRNAGYDVIYKVHPGRISEAKDIFEKKAYVLKGYIQNHLKKADVFLSPSIMTTAFSFILCTNKPIIIFDFCFKIHPPFPEAMELFKKRCSVVKTTIDERNRIIFDEKELLAALSQKPEQPNTEFIKTYMFPEG
jgi:hypothetical protein